LGCGVFTSWSTGIYHKAYGHAVASAMNEKWIGIMAVVGGLLDWLLFIDNNLKPAGGFCWAGIGRRTWMNIFGFRNFAHHWYAPIAPYLDCLSAGQYFTHPGRGGWWRQIGIRNQFLGVCLVAGVLVAITGIITHFYFHHNLPKTASHD